MPNKENKEWRKKRIEQMSNGSGVTDITIKQGVDVINSVIEDLTESIENSSKSSDRLSLIIAVATALLVAVGIAGLCIS